MPERCKKCGEVYADFWATIYRAPDECGPFEHVEGEE